MTRALAGLIRDRARRDPQGVALREKSLGIWQETTWARYGDLVERAAHGLLTLGVRPEDRVAVQSDNRPEWLVAEASADAVRAVAAGIDPDGESEDALRDSAARVLVAEDQEQVDEALAAKDALPGLEWIVYVEPRGVRDYHEPSLLWWPDLLERGDEHRREHPRMLDELAAQESDLDPAANDGRGPLHPDPGPSDFVLCHVPLWQPAGRLSGSRLSAEAGVQLHFGEPSAGLRQSLREVQPSLLAAAPPLWELLRATAGDKMASPSWLKRRIGRDRLGLGRCRSAVSLSPLEPELVGWFRGLGVPLRAVGEVA